MSKQLSLYQYLPKRPRRADQQEEHAQANHMEQQISETTQTSTSNVTTTINSASSRNSIQVTDDIASSPECLPVQPVDIQFPVTYFSSKARSFNQEWFRLYPWLEYSVLNDAAYCYPCRLFSLSPSTSSSRPEKAFTIAGFRDWKHATGSKGVLSTHNNCFSHKESMVAWEQFKSTATTGSVAEQLGSNRAEQIKKNRHYIKTVALLCSKQELALRGNNESSESLNKGNFKEILTLVARHDPVVADRLFHGPKNAIYTSPIVQNEIINIMANIVRRQISTLIQKAGYYSILADETKDASKQEQLSIAIRYVECSSVVERFLTFTIASDLDADHLSKYILDTLALHNLDVSKIVSQGYDGASVMSGRCSGVQQRIREIVPQAVYVHCRAHCLNLVLVDCVKNNTQASEFFSLVQSLYVFMSSSKAHVIFLEMQTKLHPEKQTR